MVLQTFRYACKPKPSSNNRNRPQLGAIAALNKDTLSAIQTLMGTAQSREASNLLVNTALKTQSASQLHSQRPGKITDQLSCSGWVFWWDCKLEAGGKSQAPPTHENHGQVMHVENAKYNSHGSNICSSSGLPQELHFYARPSPKSCRTKRSYLSTRLELEPSLRVQGWLWD